MDLCYQNLKHNLLGLPGITALHLAAQLLDSTYTAMVQNQFPSVFQGLRHLGEPYSIKFQQNFTPFALNTPKAIPLPLLSQVQAELTRLKHKG